MRRLRVVAVLAAVSMLAAGCPKKEGGGDKPGDKPDTPKVDPKTPPPKKPAAGGLAADKDFAAGNVQAAVLELETKLDIPGFGTTGPKVGDDVKAAQAASTLKQAITVSDDRGRMVFTTEDSYIPKGTELRYKPGAKYVLADTAKKTYWVMTGGELGNLLEGGPGMERSNYTVEVKDTTDKETVAGVEAVKSDAKIGFDWKVKTKTGVKSGKIKVSLLIWHSADAKFKDAWGDMIIDFLAVPFQDPNGQEVIKKLKNAVKFPVKWSMEVVNEGAKMEKDEKPPKLVTTAVKVEVKDAAKADLAYPPAGLEPASGPYTFGEGGQTAKEDLLGKIPAKAGKPPKDVEPPTDDKK